MERHVSFKNAHISYTVHGKGYPVLLLHGFGEDGSIWEQQIQHLSSAYKIIVPDLPGSGKSTLLQEPLVKISDYAEVIYALCEHEKINDMVLIGHSMGGYITLAFADRFGKKLKGFGWVHSTAFADSEEKKIIRQKSIEAIKEHGPYSFLKTTIANLFSNHTKQTNRKIIDALIEKAYGFTAAALIQYYNAMILRPDTTHVLKNATVPVLMIAGTEDNAAPLQDVIRQSSMPDVCYFNILEQVGHMGMMENPDKTNALIMQYLNDLKPVNSI